MSCFAKKWQVRLTRPVCACYDDATGGGDDDDEKDDDGGDESGSFGVCGCGLQRLLTQRCAHVLSEASYRKAHGAIRV